MRKKRIYINVGHGGKDTGASGWYGILEKDINLKTALWLAQILIAHGFEVMLSRTDDIYVSIEASAAEANAWGADIVISVHHNAGGGDGAEVIVSIDGTGDRFAQFVLAQFTVNGQNLHGCGVIKKADATGRNDYFGIIRLTKMLAIITEYAFIDSKDVEAVDTDDDLYNEAACIAHAVCDYFSVPWIIEQKTPLQLAVEKLVAAGKINSPQYWLNNAQHGQTVSGENAAALIMKWADSL